MNTKQLIELLKPHKNYLTTVKKWDEYAKEHGLPPSVTLIYHFESWNNVKNTFNLPVRSRNLSKSDLEKIALQYKPYFERKSIWDEYSKKHSLPTSSTFIKVFGSWTNVKVFVGVNSEKKKRDLYSKEDIRKILMKHAKNYESRKQWDEYAKEHRLPTYKTIKKHFEYDEILDIVQKEQRRTPWKIDKLMKVVKKHKQVFLDSSYSQWNEYAKINQLPSSFVFHNAFGSWNAAKTEIAMRL